MSTQVDRVVVPWYSEETYTEILAVMEDATCLPDNYTWWRQGAEEQVKVMRHDGRIAAPVTIDPQLFLAWCAEHELPPNAESRLEYAASRGMSSLKER